MPYLYLDSHRIYYEEGGRGPTLILLHHATGCTRDWKGHIAAFRQAGYHTVVYDRLGFGRSDPLEKWTPTYHHRDVAELLALMDALHLERAGLVGHSDGATIALLAAAAAPERIAAVVAEAPHMWYDDRNVNDAFELFTTTIARSERFWKAMRRDHGPHAEQVLRRWHNTWMDPAMRQWDERPQLAKIRCPVLVLHGRADFFFPVDHSSQIADAITGATFHLFEDAGHIPHQETPAEFRRLVLSFLAATYPAIHTSPAGEAPAG
ncbi:MAG: alpha/beta hydrolase [Caldilineae bacterium]|nr:MAG: alpha/beta hydrolase [Caldilineae bacterium]